MRVSRTREKAQVREAMPDIERGELVGLRRQALVITVRKSVPCQGFAWVGAPWRYTSVPANLPPQYLKVEDEYRKAQSAETRLEKLREMFRLLPKHKGTEKLQSDLKQKISQLKDEQERGKAAGKKGGRQLPRAARRGRPGDVDRAAERREELAAGRAHQRPARDRALSVHDPAPSAGDHDVAGCPRPACRPPGDLRRIRRAVGAERDPFGRCRGSGRRPGERRRGRRRRSRCSTGSQQTHTELVGELPFDNEDESTRHLKTVMAPNKLDCRRSARPAGGSSASGSSRGFRSLRFRPRRGEGLESLRTATYHLLGVMRIYTKVPGRPADRAKPFTLPLGSTVLDLAREIHRDFEHSLKSARIWGTGVFDGQAVKHDHELHDGDLVELHVS